MKQTLFIAIFLCSIGTAFGQKHKPDTTKKIDTKVKAYTLFLQVDSLTFIQVQQNISKVSNHLEASTAPHNEVQADQQFLKQIYELFETEYKEQHKKK